MKRFSSGRHSRYDLKYHLVWVTKHRKPILRGNVRIHLRELVREICSFYGVIILEGAVGSDHVHLLVSCSPSLTLSSFIREVKRKTAIELFSLCPELNEHFTENHLWARGFFVTTTGTVTEETIREYIRNQA